VGRNQAEFIEVFGEEVLPHLKLDGKRPAHAPHPLPEYSGE
jgi:hypothetical protein